MRSPNRRSAFAWLVAKDWRELWSARAWWLMLVVTGPLVGMSFINAMQNYAEMSGYNGTSFGVGEAFSPLVGIWAPTFSAYELIAAFLFPFVVIRLVAADSPSGVLKIELQQRLRPWVRIASKTLVLSAAWAVACVPMLLAAALWEWHGGHTYVPEVLTVVAGHGLNALLTIAIGSAAASAAEHPSTAAIIALTVTVGTWIVSFFAALHGGWWERVSAFTQPALVAQFQHGLIRLDVLLAVLVLTLLGLAVGAAWSDLGETVARRLAITSALIAGASALVALATLARPTADLSENRQNSFAEVDEEALGQITGPLRIEAHFAPEDGRRGELERRALSKLRRVMPDLTVEYVSRTSVGMFEQNTEHYGEVIYSYAGRTDVSRIVTAEGVLEAIYRVTGLTPPAEDESDAFRGYPLPVPPRGAAWIFYGAWPALIAGFAFIHYRRTSS